MNNITAKCSIEVGPVAGASHYEDYCVEMSLSRIMLEACGAVPVTWVGRKTAPDEPSLHHWHVRCTESVLTALRLRCSTVTVLEDYMETELNTAE